MKKLKTLLSIALAAIMLLSVPAATEAMPKLKDEIALSAGAANRDETHIWDRCGENSFWSYEKATGEFRIYGTGEADPYNVDYQISFADIKSLVIEDGITDVEKLTFELDNIESLYIGKDLTISPDVMLKWLNTNIIKTIVVSPENPLYDSRNNCNAIMETATNRLLLACPATVIPEDTEIIDANAFNWGGVYGDLIIPEGVKKIETSDDRINEPFINRVYISSTVTEIGYGTSFSYAKEIVVSPENPVYDSRNNCNAIIETATDTLISGCGATVIPEDIKVIAPRAYREYHGVTDIVIPDSVVEIGDEAIPGSYGLRSIKFSKNLKRIGSDNFIFSYALKELDLPDSLEYIGENCFEFLVGIERIHLPENLESYSSFCFSGIYGLTQLTLPEKLTSLAFYDEDSTEEIKRRFSSSAITDLTVLSKDLDLTDTGFGLTLSEEYYYDYLEYSNQLIKVYEKFGIGITSAYYDFSYNNINEFDEIINAVENSFEDEMDSLNAFEDELEEKYKNIPEEYKNGNFSAIKDSLVQIPGFMLHCYSDSKAHEYAIEYGLDHELLDGCDTACGKHTNVYNNDYIAPTCTENGYRGGSLCLDCEIIFEAPEVIAPKGHSVVNVPEIPATCTDGGVTAYSYCSTCRKFFSEPQTITPTGHSDSNNDGICDVCGEETGESFETISFIERVRRYLTSIIDRIVALFRRLFG